jgi:hypothetical protein
VGVLATGISATAWVLAVLANAAMAGTDVSALLAVLPEPCGAQQPAKQVWMLLRGTAAA